MNKRKYHSYINTKKAEKNMSSRYIGLRGKYFDARILCPTKLSFIWKSNQVCKNS